MRTHEASRVGVVGSDLSIDLDKTLSDDESDLTSGQSVLELVLEEDLRGNMALTSAFLAHPCDLALTDRGRDSLSL